MQRVMNITLAVAALFFLLAIWSLVGSDAKAMQAHDEWMQNQQDMGAWVVE